MDKKSATSTEKEAAFLCQIDYMALFTTKKLLIGLRREYIFYSNSKRALLFDFVRACVCAGVRTLQSKRGQISI